MPHLLDRPIYHALRTRQAALAIGNERALRYDQAYTPFAAAEEDDSAEALEALAALVPADAPVVLLQRHASAVPPGCLIEKTAEGIQMVLGALAAPGPHIRTEPLGNDDAPAMQALAKLTEPGPFSSRTHELGQFFGVKENGRLLAMAGERMKLPGFTEVSGVATHPDARGRGYAAHLTRLVAARILERGETPFLHAYASNVGAIRLYESLGFRLRCPMRVIVLRRRS